MSKSFQTFYFLFIQLQQIKKFLFLIKHSTALNSIFQQLNSNPKIFYISLIKLLYQQKCQSLLNIIQVKQIKQINKLKQRNTIDKDKMMNVRNFYLKSAVVNFNPQLTGLTNQQLKKQNNNKIKDKKVSPKVQSLMKNFKVSSKFGQNYKNTIQKCINQPSHFDFQPPLIQINNKRKYKNQSCTLSPRKQVQTVSSYQLYKTVSKKRNHIRGFSQGNFENRKLFQQYQTQKKFYKSQRKSLSLDNGNNIENNQNKSKIKVFQMQNIFKFDVNYQIIHRNHKHGSSFISTLPSKRKNSTSVNKLGNSSNKNKTKINRTSPSKLQQYDQVKRLVHTAASGTARRIDFDKINFKPISSSFFPNSSIWNKQDQFVRPSNHQFRTYKVGTNKFNNFISSNKGKQQGCRPWSPNKVQNPTNYEEQEAFLVESN